MPSTGFYGLLGTIYGSGSSIRLQTIFYSVYGLPIPSSLPVAVNSGYITVWGKLNL